MRRRLTAALLLAVLLAATAMPTSARTDGAPRGFFGIVPQTPLTEADAEYMRAGGIETVRWPMVWSEIQPSPRGGYNWGGMDQTMTSAALTGLRVLPTISSTPHWLGKPTTLPIANARQRRAWIAFLQAAVDRYGPGGEFWAEHAHEGINYEPALPSNPIREWQVWNEANFFYFTYPVSPSAYARLVKLSSRVIKGIDPRAKVILAGLFGEPTATGSKGMPAATFLDDMYRTPGIKSSFDGVALHPYAVDTETLEELVQGVHEATVANHDRVPLYITEMGWGSQNDFNKVAFEQGIKGQVRELRGAYNYLLANRRRLNVKQVDWFSWKDVHGACTFCDSVGFFRSGPRFHPKPAWRTFIHITGGRVRP